MSRCGELRDELADVALGGQAGDALSRHLAECPACAAELERQQALARRMDAAVRTLVQAQPPARMLEGVATRVRVAQRRPARRAWGAIAAGAAIAASVALIFGLRALQPQAPVAGVVALTHWRSPTASLLEPRGSVLRAPLGDVWFDFSSRPSHSEPSPGESHGT